MLHFCHCASSNHDPTPQGIALFSVCSKCGSKGIRSTTPCFRPERSDWPVRRSWHFPSPSPAALTGQLGGGAAGLVLPCIPRTGGEFKAQVCFVMNCYRMPLVSKVFNFPHYVCRVGGQLVGHVHGGATMEFLAS